MLHAIYVFLSFTFRINIHIVYLNCMDVHPIVSIKDFFFSYFSINNRQLHNFIVNFTNDQSIWRVVNILILVNDLV